MRRTSNKFLLLLLLLITSIATFYLIVNKLDTTQWEKDIPSRNIFQLMILFDNARNFTKNSPTNKSVIELHKIIIKKLVSYDKKYKKFLNIKIDSNYLKKMQPLQSMVLQDINKEKAKKVPYRMIRDKVTEIIIISIFILLLIFIAFKLIQLIQKQNHK